MCGDPKAELGQTAERKPTHERTISSFTSKLLAIPIEADSNREVPVTGIFKTRDTD